jgi:hypothetical protein
MSKGPVKGKIVKRTLKLSSLETRKNRSHHHIASFDDLKVSSTRFYIYEDPSITMSSLVKTFRLMGTEALKEPSRLDHVITDSRAEQDVLSALEMHPLRTMDPNEAAVFIVPTPMSELLSYGCQWEECTWYDEVFGALLNHPIYKRSEGHNHVLISFNWLSFNKRMSSFIPALSRNYRRIENLTVANHYDPFGCLELTEPGTVVQPYTGFNFLFIKEYPVTKSFSIGLGIGNTFELQLPSFQKFQEAKHFLFYHSRGPEAHFAYGSTKYRMAPLAQRVIEVLPPSSIGYEIAKDEWVRDFISSQYCLIIRGDTPHSHALINAVRAGCLPVIVSDYYDVYAPPFKSTLSMQDFAFFILESEFLKNPARELLLLQNLHDDVIQEKLFNLTLVQSILLPDHPKSLFVEAFLKETIAVDRRFVPEVYTRRPIQVREGTSVISGNECTYRYPSTFSESEDDNDGQPIIFTGVISSARNHNRRHVIRGTWAEEYENPMRVFFVVAGRWEDIEQEFFDYGDLLWLDMNEGYRQLTYKTQILFFAVDKHVKKYDFLFKTHDDAYVSLQDLNRIGRVFKPDYWGLCGDGVSCTNPVHQLYSYHLLMYCFYLTCADQ